MESKVTPEMVMELADSELLGWALVVNCSISISHLTVSHQRRKYVS